MRGVISLLILHLEAVNTYGYDYAIKMDITRGNYTVYKLDNNPAFQPFLWSRK